MWSSKGLDAALPGGGGTVRSRDGAQDQTGQGSICGGMQRHGRVLSKGVKGPDFPVVSRTTVSITNP